MDLLKQLLHVVDCSRGAPMGRRECREIPAGSAVRFHLRAIPLDAGGYDRGGAYWGHGGALYLAYACQEQDGGKERETLLFFRAPTRERAKAALVAEYKNATFYR